MVKLPFSMRSAMETLSKRPRAQTERQGFADPVKLLLGGEAHRADFFVDVFRLSSEC